MAGQLRRLGPERRRRRTCPTMYSLLAAVSTHLRRLASPSTGSSNRSGHSKKPSIRLRKVHVFRSGEVWKAIHCLPVGFVVDRHHPALRRLVPEQARVAALMLDDRVARELGPGPAAVVGIGDALAAARARVGGDEQVILAVLPARRVGPVDDRAAGEGPVAEPPRVDRDRQLLPVHQVAADGVAPVHVAPVPAVGIVLEEEVILAAANRPARWGRCSSRGGARSGTGRGAARGRRRPAAQMSSAWATRRNAVGVLGAAGRRAARPSARARRRRRGGPTSRGRRPARSRTRGRSAPSTSTAMRRFGAPVFTGRWR